MVFLWKRCRIISIYIPIFKDLISSAAEKLQCISAKLETETQVKEQKQEQENTDRKIIIILNKSGCELVVEDSLRNELEHECSC